MRFRSHRSELRCKWVGSGVPRKAHREEDIFELNSKEERLEASQRRGTEVGRAREGRRQRAMLREGASSWPGLLF